ncbi:anhydro-N-acetylmuramic acid kinase [Alphaproteobacteria bacterium]|nr:anhydro-N-acetylmuramic acid kinase [Alphaproteobacteria bacterium]
MKKFKAIGLMSGTSMDGIDLALIESDGVNFIKKIASDYLPYQQNFKNKIIDLLNNQQCLKNIKIVENELTNHHISLVNSFLKKNNLTNKEIDIIGFHGHTVCHDPINGFSWQIGNSQLLAYQCQIDVISDFRNRDILMKGQGSPLVPIYHFHLLKNYPQFDKKNIGILNIGGVSNISIFNTFDENSLLGYDVCFGNAPFDDSIRNHCNQDFDKDGELTLKGKINFEITNEILTKPIFHKKIPRSFDRQDFKEILKPLNNLHINDKLASMAYIIAQALKISFEIINIKPQFIFLCGGGRKNIGIINIIKEQLNTISIDNIDQLDLNGDDIEAEAFAFLAIRSILNLPISFANTTGLKDALKSTAGITYKK